MAAGITANASRRRPDQPGSDRPTRHPTESATDPDRVRRPPAPVRRQPARVFRPSGSVRRQTARVFGPPARVRPAGAKPPKVFLPRRVEMSAVKDTH